MEIVEERGIPDFGKIIHLIKLQWPVDEHETSEEQMVNIFQEHFNGKTDVIKYLLDEKKIIGYYRYSPWPREDEETEAAHCFDVALMEEYQGR